MKHHLHPHGLLRLPAAALSLAALAGLTAAASRPAMAQDTVPAYRFVDLGTLAGLYTTATGINDAGQITGFAHDGIDNRAYRLDPVTDAGGKPIWFLGNGNINTLMKRVTTDSTHPYSESWNVNKWGEMAGQALGSGYTTPQHAFFWTANLTGVQLSNTASWSWGDINDLSSVAGVINPNKGGAQATVWRRVSGGFAATTIPRPAGYEAGYAEGLNNRDQAVGYFWTSAASGSQPFLWLPTSAYGLAAGTHLLPTSGGTGQAKDVNDTGSVVGFSGSQAALWTPDATGGPMTLSPLTDGSAAWRNSYANGLNSPATDQPLKVVGNAENALAERRAFVWDSAGGLRDLNALTVNPPQGSLTEARRVNRDGLIVGYFTLTTKDGNKSPIRAFLLVPDATLPAADAAPAAPAVLAGVKGVNEVRLSWEDVSANENGFKISRSGNALGTAFRQIGTTGPDATTFTDTFEDQAYVPSYRYTYRVSAYNVRGYSTDVVTQVITPGAPLAPSAVKASPSSGPSRIRLTWTNNTNVQDVLTVERSGNGGATFTLLTSIASATATSYEDLTVTPGSTYSYRLRTHTATGGYSADSAVVSAAAPRR